MPQDNVAATANKLYNLILLITQDYTFDTPRKHQAKVNEACRDVVRSVVELAKEIP